MAQVECETPTTTTTTTTTTTNTNTPSIVDNVIKNDHESAVESEKKPYRRFTKQERKEALKLRRQERKESKNAGISEFTLKQTDYYFENGLRKVYPYYYGWNTTVKERWFGKTVFEVYSQEFVRSLRNVDLKQQIETGKIRVNGQIKPNDYKLKNGDRISHSKHRHEVPVLDDEIKVISEDDDYLVIDKPCSLPMHPCGKYRYNCLSSILTKEMGFKNLRTQYRLDRLTSGLVVMGKNFRSALVLDKHIKERTARKVYLSRVLGEFPKERQIVDAPIDCASRKIGLYWIDEKEGKTCRTEFERVSYNGHTSVVLCYPKTGRTHQIRIHLQYLGYPIINDPLYNQPSVWGPANGKCGEYAYTKEEIEARFLDVHTYEAWIIKQEEAIDSDNEDDKEKDKDNKIDCSIECLEQTKKTIEVKSQSNANDDSVESISKRKLDERVELKDEENNLDCLNSNNSEPTTKKTRNDDENVETCKETTNVGNKQRPGFDPKRLEIDPDCFECKQTYREPSRRDLIMYLHAYSYKFGDIEFKTEYPEWAKEDFVEPDFSPQSIKSSS